MKGAVRKAKASEAAPQGTAPEREVSEIEITRALGIPDDWILDVNSERAREVDYFAADALAEWMGFLLEDKISVAVSQAAEVGDACEKAGLVDLAKSLQDIGNDAAKGEMPMAFAKLKELWSNCLKNFYDDELVDEDIEKVWSAYTDAPPSSPPADTRQKGMADDFNTELAVSRYELLARRVDLLNPRLPQTEKVTRAERLVKAYNRLRKVKPEFHDTGDELRAARRIQRAHQRKSPKLAK